MLDNYCGACVLSELSRKIAATLDAEKPLRQPPSGRYNANEIGFLGAHTSIYSNETKCEKFHIAMFLCVRGSGNTVEWGKHQ